MREQNGHPYSGITSDDNDEGLPLTEELDHEILMARDAHFGGDFAVMLNYYMSDGFGVDPELPIDRIEYLAQVETELEKNLAPLMLSGPEAERVARARGTYRQLKEVYNLDEASMKLPRLIADLILSEDEDREEEMQALIALGDQAIGPLCDILKSDDTYDPLFPGYGYAPAFAMLCLGHLKAKEAVPLIFEVLRKEIVFDEEHILDALADIGEEAKQFLLKQIKARPFTNDHENAAFALAAFPEDEEVGRVAFEELKKPDTQAHTMYANYLIVFFKIA